jgi:hypothetical protein
MAGLPKPEFSSRLELRRGMSSIDPRHAKVPARGQSGKPFMTPPGQPPLAPKETIRARALFRCCSDRE